MPVPKGHKFSRERNKKISETRKKRKFPAWNKGLKLSFEHKRKIAEARMGVGHSEETKEKIRQGKLGEKGFNWKGGKRINSDGYVFIYKPTHPRANCDRYVLEHRLVWEEYWKELIPDGYVIHHLDSNRQNNHITNLTSMIDGAHLGLHKKRYLKFHIHT